MPITDTNAKKKTYYLHQGTTKIGKPKYYFSMKCEGTLADSIPEGFEIYEAPDARVFLRRIPPKIIWDKEKQVVEDEMRKYSGVQDYKIDIRGNTIEVYTAIQERETFSEMFAAMRPAPSKAKIAELVTQLMRFSLRMKFVLEDEECRTFVAQCPGFFGWLDDWIDIEKPGKLSTLVEVLLVEYALTCLLQPTASADWGYRIARQYAERYNSRYPRGLIPESAPMVKDIADFWCQYHMGKPLQEWLGAS